MARYTTSCIATSRGTANVEDIFFEISAAYGRIVAINIHSGDGHESAITESQYTVKIYSATSVGSGGSNTNTTMDATTHLAYPNGGGAVSSFISIAQPMNPNFSAAQATIKVKANTTNFTAGAGTNKLLWTDVVNIRERFSYISRDDHAQWISNSSTAIWITISTPNTSQVFTVDVIHEE